MPFLGVSPTQEFTSVAKQTITGDGSTSYTLNKGVSTENDLAVFVNDVRQEPGVAYTASANTITFTANLESTDSCYVLHIGRSFSSAESPGIEDNATSKVVTIQSDGHIVPTANVTYDLGTSDLRFRDLYLSGSSLHLGAHEMTANATHVSMGNVVTTGVMSGNAALMTSLNADELTSGTLPLARLPDDVTIVNDLTIGGDFIVNGNTTTIAANELKVEDSLIQLATNNEISDTIDIGFVGHYSNDGNTALHTGFFRDASDEQYYLFNGYVDAAFDTATPPSTIDRTANTFSLADLNVGNLFLESAGPVIETTATNNSSGLRLNVVGNTGGQLFRVQQDGTTQFIVEYDGNVGIGISNPSNPLHVSSTSTDVAKFATSGSYTYISLDNATRNWALSVGSAFSVYDATAAATRMVIDSSGNIGIGNTNPTTIGGDGGRILTLYNTSHASFSVQAVDGTNDRNATVEILSSGNGGSLSKLIYGDTDTTPGTPSSLAIIQRSGGSNTERVRIDAAGDLYVQAGGELRVVRSAASNYSAFYTDTADSTIINNSWSNKKIVLDRDGNVGIGITSPTNGYNSTAALDVQGPILARGALAIHQTNSGSLDYFSNTFAIRSHGATAGTGEMSFRVGGGGGSADFEAIRIHNSGKVRIGPGSGTPIGTLHISSGTSGDCVLTLEADTDNNNEGDTPQIIFVADGGIREAGIVKEDNQLDIISNVSGSGGVRFFTGTTDNYTNDVKNGATERMSIASDGRVTLKNRVDFDELLIGTTAGKYIQVTGSSSTAWTTSSSGGVSTPGTASTEYAFHHWNGSAWSQALGITSDSKITYVSNLQRTDEIGGVAGYGKWISPGSAYSYDATNGVRYHWWKIGTWSSSATGRIKIQYEAKNDLNYPNGVTGEFTVSQWATNSSSVSHDGFGQNGAEVQVRIDTSGNVWIRMQGITWSHHWRYRIHQANSGFTVRSSWTYGTDQLDSAVHSTPPANSTDNILVGDNHRFGGSGSNLVTSSSTKYNYYADVGAIRNRRQPSFYADLSSNVTFSGPNSFGTAVPFNREYVDPTNSFNTGNGLFTAPTTGWYMFDASAFSQGGSNFQQSWFVINGSRGNHTDSVYCATSYASNIVVNKALIYLTGGDTVGFHPYNGNSSQTITANQHHTYFKGYFLG